VTVCEPTISGRCRNGRVLKSKSLNFYSVRNHNDKFYHKGIEVDKGIYDVNGFQVRFFTEEEIQDLAKQEGFEIFWIKKKMKNQLHFFLYQPEKFE